MLLKGESDLAQWFAEFAWREAAYLAFHSSSATPSLQVTLARDLIGGNAKGKPIHRLPQI